MEIKLLHASCVDQYELYLRTFLQQKLHHVFGIGLKYHLVARIHRNFHRKLTGSEVIIEYIWTHDRVSFYVNYNKIKFAFGKFCTKIYSMFLDEGIQMHLTDCQ